jgi:hypothetical protein
MRSNRIGLLLLLLVVFVVPVIGDVEAGETFELPAGHRLQIHACADANYTQAGIFHMYKQGVPQPMLNHRFNLYYQCTDVTLPVVPFEYPVRVVVSGMYLYTDSDWGPSLSRIDRSSPNHYILGFDDSTHDGTGDRDYNDLRMVVDLVKGRAKSLFDVPTLQK